MGEIKSHFSSPLMTAVDGTRPLFVPPPGGVVAMFYAHKILRFDYVYVASQDE